MFTQLNRANGEECCVNLHKPFAVCVTHSMVDATGTVLIHHCETLGALFEIKVCVNSRNRPLFWAVTEGDGRETWR